MILYCARIRNSGRKASVKTLEILESGRISPSKTKDHGEEGFASAAQKRAEESPRNALTVPYKSAAQKRAEQSPRNTLTVPYK